MEYTHLNMFQRGKLEALRKMGMSCREIAKEVGCHASTISRELRRNTKYANYYDAEIAQLQYFKRRQNSKQESKITPEIKAAIEEKLRLSWSPEQVVGRCLKGIVSYKTIYVWIRKGFINGSQHLRQKGKRQKQEERRGKLRGIRSIHERPNGANSREVFGHWELDTVVSGRGKSKACLATLLKRKTRMYIVVPMEDRTAASMLQALKQVVTQYPKSAFKSFTTDRGKEFACHEGVERSLEIPVYFADAYSSWQRGSNENANGLLREFIPKATNLAKVTNDYLFNSLCKIINRPRKMHQWKTSLEVFEEELLHLS